MSANPVMAGFFGKLPCRGDFVRSGLPGRFVTAWDRWVSAALESSRAAMGETWRAAWLEAPVWRFVLPAGLCGPDAVLGLWMPSVDSTGRYFPLVLAAVFPGRLAVRSKTWLDAAEEIGRVAIESDTNPASLATGLAALDPPAGAQAGAFGLWWTEGAPRVAAAETRSAAMPTAAVFAAMLGAP